MRRIGLLIISQVEHHANFEMRPGFDEQLDILVTLPCVQPAYPALYIDKHVTSVRWTASQLPASVSGLTHVF